MHKRLIFIFLILIKSAFASYSQFSFDRKHYDDLMEKCTANYQFKIEMGWEKHQMYGFCKCSLNEMFRQMRQTDKLPSERQSQQITNECINLIQSNYQHY
jgi:hypothetical protein